MDNSGFIENKEKDMTMKELKDEYDRQRHVFLTRIKCIKNSNANYGEKRLRIKSLREYLSNLTYASKMINRYFDNKESVPIMVVLPERGEAHILAYK